MAKRGQRMRRSKGADRHRDSVSPHERRIVVLFADIIGASEVSNHKGLSDYNKFLQEFHRVFLSVTDEHMQAWYPEQEHRYFTASVRGDEGCLMVFVPKRANLADDVDTAVNTALDLKRQWLLSDFNRERIRGPELLPADVAVGIHVGKAYINEDKDDSGKVVFRPEGYAINLTKRIEGASRDGHFTHIYVSEAARGELYLFADEATYTFAQPHSIPARGISRDIRVYEVKHHFLPTDWGVFSGAVRTNRAVDFVPTEEECQVAERAHQANPTNLWLAEEYVMLKMQFGYEQLKKRGLENDVCALREAYQAAEQVCRRFATGDLRDAGILAIAGFIAGEYESYREEQKLYDEALDMDPQYAEAYWYRAFSKSAELAASLEKDGRPEAGVSDLTEDERGSVEEIMKAYGRAIELNPGQSWMHADLAWELGRWGRIEEAAGKLVEAVRLNPKVRHWIEEAGFPKSVIGDERVRQIRGKE